MLPVGFFAAVGPSGCVLGAEPAVVVYLSAGFGC